MVCTQEIHCDLIIFKTFTMKYTQKMQLSCFCSFLKQNKLTVMGKTCLCIYVRWNPFGINMLES